MTEERDGNVVTTYKPDGHTGKALDVYLDDGGTFHIYLVIEGQEDELDVYDNTLQGVQQKTSKTLLQKRPAISIKGTLIEEDTGRTLRATFVGLHAGTGQPRFRLPSGKAVSFERWSRSSDEWDLADTLFVPDGIGMAQREALTAKCAQVGELEKQLQTSKDARTELVEESAIDCDKIHTGYGRMKSTELAEMELDAAQRIKNLIPGGDGK